MSISQNHRWIGVSRHQQYMEKHSEENSNRQTRSSHSLFRCVTCVPVATCAPIPSIDVSVVPPASRHLLNRGPSRSRWLAELRVGYSSHSLCPSRRLRPSRLVYPQAGPRGAAPRWLTPFPLFGVSKKNIGKKMVSLNFYLSIDTSVLQY